LAINQDPGLDSSRDEDGKLPDRNPSGGRIVKLAEAPAISKVAPAIDGVDAPFWDGLDAGEVRIQRCRDCGIWQWPAVWRCPDCGSWTFDWSPVVADGLIYSWIRTWQAFAPEMRSVIPYVTVLVELPQVDGRRLLGILVDGEQGLDIGAPVEGVIQPGSALTSGRAVLRWRLKEKRP
jgi:uncharacterized OB-fold protein